MIDEYLIQQRTAYSKFQLINRYTGENITNGNEHILEKIVEDYQIQDSFPKHYFEIKDNVLISFKKQYGKDLEYIFVPSNVVSIGMNAFEDAEFKKISLPQQLKNIDDYAFKNCTNLKYINIPNEVVTVGNGIFKDCLNLENIDLSSSMFYIGKEAFQNCISIKHLDLPDTVSTIEADAFASCNNLESINLSQNLRVIGDFVFCDCNKLKSIELPSKLEYIGENCFNNCLSLKEIIIPNFVTIISKNMFLGCENLENVKLPNLMFRIDAGILAGCTNLKKLNLPDTIHIIDENTFINTPKIEEINIPKGLMNPCDPVFANSNINTIIINFDLLAPNCSDGLYSSDLISGSKVERLIISGDIKTISPDVFQYSGSQIKEIKFLGTKEEFDKFKNNNQELFTKCLTNVKNINFSQRVKYKMFDAFDGFLFDR